MSSPNSILAGQYRLKKYSFPLIKSVLDGNQEGSVYWNGLHPNYFVIHKFGFADLIELEPSKEFDEGFLNFLLERNFEQEKLRWYDVPEKWQNVLKNSGDTKIAFVERVQLKLDASRLMKSINTSNQFRIEPLTISNYDLIDNHFNLSIGARFWSSKNHFFYSSFGLVVLIDDLPAGVCYGCAIADKHVEVDVFTHPAHRSQGIGKIIVNEFIHMCDQRGLTVNWDCYSNNKASVALAKHFNFIPVTTYMHAIISR